MSRWNYQNGGWTVDLSKDKTKRNKSNPNPDQSRKINQLEIRLSNWVIASIILTCALGVSLALNILQV